MTTITDFAHIGNPDAPVGSPEWCLAAHMNLCVHKHNHDAEVSSLKYGLREFKNEQRWRQLTDRDGRKFRYWRQYVQCPEPYGLGMPVEEAEAVIKARDDKRLLREVLSAREMAASDDVPPLRPEAGRPPKNDNGSNTTISDVGRGAAYLVAKLKRDAPEFAERLAAGEFKSARACALAAGVIEETTPLTKLRRAWKRATPEERTAFLAEIMV